MRRLEKNPGKPVYLQLADRIREEIAGGRGEAGSVLGSAAEVAALHGVRSGVADRALSLLREQGWVRRSKAGVFSIDRPRSARGVFLTWDPAGLELEAAGPVEVRVLSKVTTSLSKELMKVFEVHGVDGAQASRIVKLHRSGDLSLALETITSPMSDLPGLLMKDHRTANLYTLIERDYGIEIEEVEQFIHQRMLRVEEAKALVATPNFPALCLDRVVRSAAQAVAFVEWVLPAGRCRVRDEAFRV